MFLSLAWDIWFNRAVHRFSIYHLYRYKDNNTGIDNHYVIITIQSNGMLRGEMVGWDTQKCLATRPWDTPAASMPMAWCLKFCCSLGIVIFSKMCWGLDKANLKEAFDSLLSNSLFVNQAVWHHIVKPVTWPQYGHWPDGPLNLRLNETRLVMVTRIFCSYDITQFIISSLYNMFYLYYF